jgi:hypothetical protein
MSLQYVTRRKYYKTDVEPTSPICSVHAEINYSQAHTPVGENNRKEKPRKRQEFFFESKKKGWNRIEMEFTVLAFRTGSNNMGAAGCVSVWQQRPLGPSLLPGRSYLCSGPTPRSGDPRLGGGGGQVKKGKRVLGQVNAGKRIPGSIPEVESPWMVAGLKNCHHRRSPGGCARREGDAHS